MLPDEDTFQDLITEIKDYQLTHGSLLKLVRFEEPTTVPARPVNVSILPTSFPSDLFNQAVAHQLHFNELYLRAASDEQWLARSLSPLVGQDTFVTALWDIHRAVRDAGVVQEVVCGIFRSDYMAHRQLPESVAPSLKQVEMNTFSVAGASHAEKVAKMHQYLWRKRNPQQRVAGTLDRPSLPDTDNIASLTEALAKAHHHYTRNTTKPPCILMVVQPSNFNIADERPIEYGLWDVDVPCYRCDWSIVLDRTCLDSDRTLFFRPPLGANECEVSVVYYRAGYDATEYDAHGRDTRLRLELSRSIKCPDVLTHLTTLKVVQVALARSAINLNERSYRMPTEISRTFMQMHTLGLDDVDELVLDPQFAKDFVLKPNLEGGGHNIYRGDISKFLQTLPKSDWPKYTLMRLIEPPEQEGVLMTPEGLYQGGVVSELGILGTCLWRRHGRDVEVLSNEAAGWTFKTKPGDVDEMSVVKGYGCFDSPLLVG